MNKPIKVLQFGMTYNAGGVESFIMNYFRNLNPNRIKTDFINMYSSIAYQEEIKELGGEIYNVTHFMKNPIKNYVQIKRLIRKNNYDIIHVNMLSAAYISPLLAAKRCGVKCIIAHSHNSSSPPGILRKFLHYLNRRNVKRYANYHLACSNVAGDWLFGKVRLKTNKSKPLLINNAIESEKFQFNPNTRRDIRAVLGIKDKFVIGHVGRFSEQKNHEFLIDIFKDIIIRKSNSVLLLIGKGDMEERIRKKVISLGLEGSVLFLGERSDIHTIMQAMDVFVLPSLYEGLPVVAIEAQASGLKCFLSDSIARDSDITGDVEFITLNGSTEDWVKKLLHYYKGYERQDTLNKIIDKGYDIKNSAAWLEKLYITISREEAN
ncbi:glycosyltransferase family 1 protein [Paenibacillus sp. J31TS4]|uniref:glycosyltransferase family 1 protein n=1 Tax=Paenibacillus sp. J31TS4 TaxID=2807195 RepID=UPI001BD0C3B5|nr:glycosyltransferase family 1 protein [Paenibacillus sp. J31TS4]